MHAGGGTTPRLEGYEKETHCTVTSFAMWSIQGVGKESSHNFRVGEDYIVGRKDCPILIASDQSISRKHASFRVKHPESNLNRPNTPSILTLKETSKYGTTCNGVKLESGSDKSLNNGDVISFGSLNTNKWRVCFNPVVVAASALPGDVKRNLKQMVHRIGGHVVSEWCPQCTHLVMSELNVTIKVISALVACRPIVTPDFFKHTLESVMEKSSLPTPGTYLPTIAEAAINKDEVSFSPDERRKEIFKDRSFFFLTEKQYKRLHIPISLAGGQSELLDEESDVPSISSRLTSSTSCVLYTEHQDNLQQMSQTGQKVTSQVLKLLKKHGLRPIPESELGLAVIYVSTALHCNPKVAQAGLDLLSAVPSQSLPTQNVLVSETQSISQNIHGGGGKVDSKATTTMKKETGSTSNLPKQNLTSTPKISKISETMVATPTRTANQTSSSRPLDGSPEFSFQEKAPMNMETTRRDVRDEQKETVTGTEIKKKDEIENEGIGRKEDRREERQVVKVKQEVFSQPNGRGDADERGGGGRNANPASSVEASEILEIKTEQPSRTEATSSKDSSPKDTQRQNGQDIFRKPLAMGKKPEKKTKDEARVEEVDRQTEQVKDEPMDQGETEVEHVLGQDDDDEDDEVVEDDPFHYERNKPKKKPDTGRTDARPESNVELKLDGKRSSKRRANWSDENDEQSNRAQTSKESDDGGGSMWKKKARIDVFSQEEEAESESQGDVQDARTGFSEDALNLPRGFISARIPIEDQVNVKIEKDYMKEEGLRSNLIKVTNAALIIRKERKTSRSRTVRESGSGREVKNFKKFRKGGYAGQSAIPRIIGGNELFTHYNNPSKDIEDMFNEEVRAEKKKDKQEEMADKLFAFESRKAGGSKRRR